MWRSLSYDGTSVMNYDYDRNDTGRGFENKHIHFPRDVAVMQ